MAYNEFEKDIIRLNRQLTQLEKRYESFWSRVFSPLGYRDCKNQRQRYENLSKRCAALYGTKWETEAMGQVPDEGSVEESFFTRLLRGVKNFFGFYHPYKLPSIEAMEKHVLACETAKAKGETLPPWGKTTEIPQAQAVKTLERERIIEKEAKDTEKKETRDKEETVNTVDRQPTQTPTTQTPTTTPQPAQTPTPQTPTPTPQTVQATQTQPTQTPQTPQTPEKKQEQPVSSAEKKEEAAFVPDRPTQIEESKPPEEKEKVKKERKPLKLPPPPRENAWEFTTNKDVVGNEKIALTNDPAVLQEFLDEKKREDPDYNEYTVQALENRIEWLKYIETVEKTSEPSKPDPDVHQNEEGELCINLDADQPLCQKSGNGCWSVSLQTQLNYRGIEINQWHIRAHRPEKEKQSIEYDLTPMKLNSDSVNSISNYSTFVNKFLPNAVIHTVGYTSYTRARPTEEEQEEREKLLREVIVKGLKEHNSPVSFVRKNHYCTIVGIEGDTVLYKDPGSGRGRNKNDPNMTYTTTISELAEASQLQLSWLQDLKVDLGGKVQDMNGYNAIGVDYSGGVYADIGEEINDYNRNFTIHEASRDYMAKGGSKSFRISSNYPVALGYKRNPAQQSGFAYNMDALGQMSEELKAFSAAGNKKAAGKAYGLVDRLSEKLDRFVSGAEDIDYEKMYAIAKDYQQLANEPLLQGGPLKEHLQQVRSALDAHLHYDNRRLGYPKRWPDKGDADKRELLENGLAGMIVASNIKEVPLTDPNWLKGYEPNNFAQAKEQVRGSEAFGAMMDGFDTSLQTEREKEIPPEKRSSMHTCQTACGGNPQMLLKAYHKELLAQKGRQNEGGVENAQQQGKTNEKETDASKETLDKKGGEASLFK